MSILRTLSMILLIGCLTACSTAPANQGNMASSTASPLPPVLVSLSTDVPGIPRVVPTSAATATLRPTATQIVTATLEPSFTPTIPAAATSTPTIIATFDTLRQTPPTLMLHRSNPDFDAVAFLDDFVQILQQHQMHVVTYQDLSLQSDLTAIEQGRLLIITIDDISLQAKIDPSIQQMIAILREAKYPAVLGIVTEGKLADEETAASLQALAEEGWELAMHTDNHVDLHLLEQTSSYGARLEIRNCAEKIRAATGVQPITLVLPYGNMVQDFKILYREQVQWVVGIVGGEKYRTTRQAYYVGRDGPSGDAAQTFEQMTKRFSSD